MRAYCDAHLAVPIYISSSIHIPYMSVKEPYMSVKEPYISSSIHFPSISYTTSCTFIYSLTPPTYKHVNIYMHTDAYTYVHKCINTYTNMYTHTPVYHLQVQGLSSNEIYCLGCRFRFQGLSVNTHLNATSRP